MKQVGIRESQTKLTTLLKELPFEITRFGKVVAIVNSPEKYNLKPEAEPIKWKPNDLSKTKQAKGGFYR